MNSYLITLTLRSILLAGCSARVTTEMVGTVIVEP
jgi:hypothetical protein